MEAKVLLNIQEITEEIKKEIKKKKQMTMKTKWLKTYGMQQKQFQEESLWQYNPNSRNKKNLK